MKFNRRIGQVFSASILVLLSSSLLIAQDQAGPKKVEPPKPSVKKKSEPEPNATPASESNQTKSDTKANRRESGQSTPTTNPTRRDPTRTPEEILELLQQPAGPSITIKARIIVANRPAVAILQLADRFVMVKVGDEINLRAQSATTTDSGRLQVLKIDSNSITLQFAASKRKLVLR